jgi:DNA-binding transcriptional ArsR family regulator
MVEQTASGIDWDDVYRALSNETRREILQQLIDENGRMHESNLVESLGRPSTVSADGGEIDEEAHASIEERVRMHLSHVHLPQLDKARLVDWNRAEETVSVTQLSTKLPVALVRPTIVHVDGTDGVQGAGD